MSSENGKNENFMRDFLKGLENYDTSQSSSEKRGASLIINGELRGTIENFICYLSQNRFQEDKDNSGRLNLGFSSSIGAEEIETVILIVGFIVRLRTKEGQEVKQEVKEAEFVFPLKYVEAMRCWLLGEYKVRRQKQEEQEVESVEEKRDWAPGISCRFSRELRDNLARAVANGAVRIEVITKKKEA